MAKKVRAITQKKTRKQLEKRLSSVLSNLRTKLGDKRFKRSIKKASKVITVQLKKAGALKRTKSKPKKKAGDEPKKTKKTVPPEQLSAPASAEIAEFTPAAE